jgi:hypothetical protein
MNELGGDNQKHIDQNQDCPLIAGTISCLSVTWVDENGCALNCTPCQHCKWWDDFCDTAEEEDAWIPND